MTRRWLDGGLAAGAAMVALLTLLPHGHGWTWGLLLGRELSPLERP